MTADTLGRLAATIRARRAADTGASYTRQLLDAGADVKTKERYSGRTCLMSAAIQPDANFIQRRIVRGADVRLVRDGKIVYMGKLGGLKRFKDDAKEVAQGYECGVSIENFNDIKVGDVIEAFTRETVVREL